MFKIKNSRILIAGLSIGLPNGLYITENPVLESDEMLVFCDENKTFYIELQADKYNNSLVDDLKAEIQLSSFVIKTDVTNIDLNKLNGCYVIYADTKSEYFELLLQCKNNNSNKYLRILITSYKNITDIQEVIEYKSVKEFINNITSEF